MSEPSALPPLSVEWKAAQGDGDTVIVTLVVEGKPYELGSLQAATESEAGTPRTCALRAAHPLRTELTCGDLSSYYAAELDGERLVITFVDPSGTRSIKALAVYAGALAVRPYAVPP
jgi:hypothetical protein